MEKQSSKHTAEMANLYQSLFESSQDGILILSYESGKIEKANPYIVQLTGYSQDELLGTRCTGPICAGPLQRLMRRGWSTVNRHQLLQCI